MSVSKSTLARAADQVLEATIIGSFTKIGIRARTSVFDWENDLPRLDGQRAVITGATSGIGRATATGLLGLGADVIVTSRSQDRADDAAAELNDEAGDTDRRGTASGHALDTGDFTSIRTFVDHVRSTTPKLDLLINNAGALTSEYQTDDRGTELTLSTHLIGPYLLMRELRSHLGAGARVLFMSSGGMYTQRLDVDSIEMSESDYSGAIAYAKAKRGQVELVTHLAPQWAPDVIMHSMHPGWVDTPGVDAGLPGFGKVMGPLLRTADEGADTMVWLAATGGGAADPGQFWLDRRTRGTSYLPFTSTTVKERQRLIDWLDEQIPAPRHA